MTCTNLADIINAAGPVVVIGIMVLGVMSVAVIRALKDRD